MIVQKLFKGLKIHVRVIVPTRLHARWTKHVRIETQVYIYTVNKMSSLMQKSTMKYVHPEISTERLFCMSKDAGFDQPTDSKIMAVRVNFVKKHIATMSRHCVRRDTFHELFISCVLLCHLF